MGFKENVAKRLLDDKRPREAVNMILKRYPDPMKSTIAVYSLWSRIRLFIASQEMNRNKYYDEKMTTLIYSIPDDHVDKDMLIRLMSSGISQQHRVQSSSRQYLVDKDYDALLKQIRVMKAPFYYFTLPEEIVKERKRVLLARAKADQRHEKRDRSYYQFGSDEVEMIIHSARDFICGPIVVKKKKDLCLLVNACQILSGRRNFEICKSLTYAKADHPMQARVNGICKKDKLRAENREDYVIPLLCEYHEWESAMNLLRHHTSYLPDNPSLVNSSIGGKVLHYSDVLFGRRLTHTQKRNLYAEVAYSHRESDNEFCIGDNSCSKHVWISKALCHTDPGPPSVTQRYQTIQIGS
jgi:hypothetical protein